MQTVAGLIPTQKYESKSGFQPILLMYSAAICARAHTSILLILLWRIGPIITMDPIWSGFKMSRSCGTLLVKVPCALLRKFLSELKQSFRNLEQWKHCNMGKNASPRQQRLMHIVAFSFWQSAEPSSPKAGVAAHLVPHVGRYDVNYSEPEFVLPGFRGIHHRLGCFQASANKASSLAPWGQ